MIRKLSLSVLGGGLLLALGACGTGAFPDESLDPWNDDARGTLTLMLQSETADDIQEMNLEVDSVQVHLVDGNAGQYDDWIEVRNHQRWVQVVGRQDSEHLVFSQDMPSGDYDSIILELESIEYQNEDGRWVALEITDLLPDGLLYIGYPFDLEPHGEVTLVADPDVNITGDDPEEFGIDFVDTSVEER